MPTLQFKGKQSVWSHHLVIPHRTLDEVQELDYKPEKAAGNIIIEGDNLLALKALIPRYTARIKCIYIDPPYNTGNGEGGSWIYSDNVNNPLIREWLGKEVGRDDLTRHDKWLCMMTPRLQLLRELLADDGVIFVSIDDNEVYHLRMLMNEIFGEENFIGQFAWRKKVGAGADSKVFFRQHEYIILYCKNNVIIDRLYQPLTDKQKEEYRNPDNDPRGLWAPTDLTRANDTDPRRIYEVSSPSSKKFTACWTYTKENFAQLEKDNRIWWGKNTDQKPKRKRFLNEKDGLTPRSWIDFTLTQDGRKDLQKLNFEKFNYPKPLKLIKLLLNIGSSKDSLILDSFAGSGTTLQAVMDLNQEDGGSRSCILVQMTEATEKNPQKNICKDITRERNKRAIEKYDYDSGFRYLRVGVPVDTESMLEGGLPTYSQLAEYVYWLCSGEAPDKSQIDEGRWFVARYKRSAIYLIYKQDYEALTKLALNLECAEQILQERQGSRFIVYAPACFLDEDYLKERHLEYVNLPFELFRRGEE